MALLEINDIHTYYGAIHALKGISLHVDEGEIVTLIGANGAGKSTTLNTICGILKPRRGAIHLGGEAIHVLPPHEIVARGVAQAPEGRRVFGRLNVVENLEMGAFARTDKDGIKRDIDRVFTLFPSPEGAVQAGGRHTFWWRAADAGHRPLAHGQPPAAAARRAVDGPGAHPGRGHL
jgi:branched-chain amino acid transport system ATP-binding protein